MLNSHVISYKDSLFLSRSFSSIRLDDGVSVYSLAYALLLFLWIALAVFDTSFLGPALFHSNIVRMSLSLGMVALGLTVHPAVAYVRKLTPCQYALLALAIVVVVMCVIKKQFLIASSLLIAFSARRFDSKWLIRVWLISVVASVSLVLLSSGLGIIPDYVIDNRGAFGRHSFGFTYTTFLSHYYLAIVCCIVYLARRRISNIALLLLLCIDTLVFLFTNSRNSFLLVLLLVVGCAFVKAFNVNLGNMPRFMKGSVRYSFLVCAVVSVVLLLLFDPSAGIGSALDHLLSSRLRLTREAFADNTIAIFGNDIHWATPHLLADGRSAIGYQDGADFIEAKYSYVDCSYLNILLVDGVIVFIGMLGLLTYMTRAIESRRDYTLGLLVLVIALHSIVDPQMLMPHYNPFLLFLFAGFPGLRDGLRDASLL